MENQTHGETTKDNDNTELPTPQQKQTPTNNTEILSPIRLSPIRRVTTNTPA